MKKMRKQKHHWIDDHFPLTSANISYTWMLYIHVWFQNKGKILIWWEYYNQWGIYQRSRVSLLEPGQNSLSIACSDHVTYAFHSESTLYSCLSVKERLAQTRRNIWNLSDCNGTRTHNHLVRKQTSDIEPVSSKEFLDTQATTECGFTQKCVCDMIRTYSQMHCRNKYSQHS